MKITVTLSVLFVLFVSIAVTGVTGEHKATLPGHTAVVYSVAFSPDGNTIASGSADGTVRLWSSHLPLP